MPIGSDVQLVCPPIILNLDPQRPVITSSSRFAANRSQSLQAVKLLGSRDQYRTSHIHVPGDEHRLPAIALNGKFYSFFRSLNDAPKATGLMLKLTARGDQVALTPTRSGYALWVYEPEALPALPAGASTPRTIAPTFDPADAWIISDRQPGFRTCSLKVTDLPDIVPGIASDRKLYSLYRRDQEPESVLKLASRLTQRGDEVVLLVTKIGYALCVEEPGATLVP
jgi:hypothetical protein